MNLEERIAADATLALKQREELRLSTLRMARSAIKNKAIELRHPVSDAEVQQVLGTLIKQRRDSAEQFRAGDREELADKEIAEIVFLEAYLPRELDAAGLEALLKEAIAETGASTARDLGKVMKASQARLQSAGVRADGKALSEAAKRLLGG